MLMDLLVADGCDLYYAEDFDPEGLSMADRLLERYLEYAKLWKIDLPSYRATQASVELSAERLSNLDSIKSNELTLIVEAMRKNKKAGYQEALLDEMIEELSGMNLS